MRDIIWLECTVCKRRNYSTARRKKEGAEKLNLKKYCKWCRKHTPHKEQKVSGGKVAK